MVSYTDGKPQRIWWKSSLQTVEPIPEANLLYLISLMVILREVTVF